MSGQAESFPPIVPVIDELQKLEAMIPEGEATTPIKNAINGLIGAVPTMIFSGTRPINFRNEQASMDRLINLVNTSTENTKEAIQRGLEYQKDNCGTWDKIWAKCSGCPAPDKMLDMIGNEEFSNLDKLKTDYITGVNEVRKEMADGMMQNCCISTSFLILTESIRLFIIWGNIKDAENCILDAEKKIKVEQNLQQVLQNLDRIGSLKQNFIQWNKTHDEMQEALEEIDDILDELRDILTETIALIGDAKVEINGKKETLIANEQQLLISLGGNAAQLALNTFQFFAGVGAANMFWKVATSAALLAHVSLIGAQVYVRVVTMETVEQCRQYYKEIVKLEAEVTKNFATYKEIKRWGRNASKRLTQTKH